MIPVVIEMLSKQQWCPLSLEKETQDRRSHMEEMVSQSSTEKRLPHATLTRLLLFLLHTFHHHNNNIGKR